MPLPIAPPTPFCPPTSSPAALSRAALSRRRFFGLGGVAALGVGGLLSGCSTGSDAPSPSAGTTPGPAGGTLDVYTWEGYDLQDGLKSWRETNQVTVKANYVGVQDDVATKLDSPAGAGIDLSTANQSFIGYFNSLDIMSPITTAELPELNQLFEVFQGKPWRNDDGTYNSVPWTWGPLGLSYVPKRLDAPTSWDIFFDPELKGRISMLDDPQQHTQLASAILGYNPDQLTKDQLAEVKDYLIRLVRQCKSLTTTTGDQVSQMESGEIDLVFLGWTGIDAAAKAKGFTATTMIPSGARSIAFSDAAFIPPKADNRDTALAFCRQLISGQVAAGAAKTFVAATTSKDVVPLLGAEDKKMFPYDDITSYFTKVSFPQGFPRDAGDFVTLDEAVAMWNEVKAGAPR